MVSSFRIRQACIFLVVATTCYILYSSLSLGSSNPQLETPTVDKLAVNVVGEDDEEKRAGGETATKRKFLLSDQSCNIPKLDINGSEVISFFHKPKPLNCHRKNPLNWAFINEEGKLELISPKKDASCKIGYIVRKNDAENYEDAVDLPISEGERLKHDFAKISCTLGDSKWSGLLMTVAENEEVRKRAQEKKREDTPMSVYFMGFDSLSQMSFRRNMPKTVDFLENTLESVVLNGYNIVGDGTPQAFIPILTAKTEEELPLTRKRYKKANYVDDVYPFIWENFTSNGYATLYAEDAFNIGTFTYRLKGFRKQPTDHFTRTFFKVNEKKSFKQWNCLGSETLHENWFRYSREFMQRYSDLPRFLLMHQSLLSHDDINQVNVQDEDFANHLKTMYNAGEFENTLVVVMADHGHRFAQLRSTHQGQLEERLPFFSFALPEKFRTTERGALIYENLKNNKDRLSTPFDIHATLMDIISSPSTAELTTVQSAEKRSLSLFRPVPVNRSCAQADVAPHWCTCLNWKDAMSDEEDKQLSSRLADIVVDTINKQLANVTNLCAALKLNQLISSKKLMPNEGLLKYKNVKDADGFVPDLSGSTTASFAHFQLKLSTAPGRAVYEVTLFYDFHKKTADIDLTSISHVNKFGDDPHCIIDTNYFLATYCVCHDRV